MFNFKYTVPLLMALFSCNTIDNNSHIQSKKADTVQIIHQPATAKASPATSQLVNAGNEIGFVKINASTEDIITVLGNPTMADAAMGKALLKWFDKNADHYKIMIFTATNMGAKNEKSRAKVIYTNRPEYRTQLNNGRGSLLDSLLIEFKELKKVGFYTDKKDSIFLYEDADKGIGFTSYSTGKCNGVYVFEKGRQQPLRPFFDGIIYY